MTLRQRELLGLPLEQSRQRLMQFRPMSVFAALLIALVGAVIGASYLNSDVDTCGWVGCYGWCQMDGTNCGPGPGMPPPGIYNDTPQFHEMYPSAP